MVEVLGVLGEEAAAQAITQLVQTHSLLADLAQSQGTVALPFSVTVLCYITALCPRGRDGGGRDSASVAGGRGEGGL